MPQPLIGITGRRLSLGMVARTSRRFQFQFINSYFSAFGDNVAAAGGIPVNVPFNVDAERVVERLDGLIVTGGQDIHPSRWGGSVHVDPAVDPRWDHDAPDLDRDDHEAALIVAALQADVPILGVCRGHQLLNVVLGGTLVEHLDEGRIVHASPNFAPDGGDDEHTVSFTPGSVAHTLYGPRRVVNSWHHQAVDRLGRGLTVTGSTADGVVEAIQLADRPVVGVQWHPEWMASPDPLFDWLVARSVTSASRPAMAGGVTC
ncbi:gamma-glutamyl-gamma-aminobutyrate hydrolase family protein [Streptomyces sp. L2]|uniref:gamma-glutamyl-gamma-aminobutyrate hydrolase family protein n=1 Tax=Streptomyces sp. L2 TaxID=2162665 RepID=UPI00101309AD|nr:gamma-glutamyl-gamma-aminobutyrate hydrolase family protein [Streptomyces sp. L2]